MQIRQISIFMPNRPGQLSQICRALSQSDINIATLSLADTSDFGIVRLIVDDHERAKEVLEKNGHAVTVSEVVAVCVPDRPGGMASVLQCLDKAGVDINYSYAFSFHKGEKAVLVFRFGDNSAAERVLAEDGYATLNEEQIGEAAK